MKSVCSKRNSSGFITVHHFVLNVWQLQNMLQLLGVYNGDRSGSTGMWWEPHTADRDQTKDMVIVFKRTAADLISILGEVQDEYLDGVHLDNRLDWKSNAEAVFHHMLQCDQSLVATSILSAGAVGIRVAIPIKWPPHLVSMCTSKLLSFI